MQRSLSPHDLIALLPSVLRGDDKIDVSAAVDLYLFLPVVRDGVKYRSSLEALLRDTRGVTGRNLDDGTVVNPDQSRSFLGAMGYLALVDQMSKAIHPGDKPHRPGGNGFERLLLWGGAVTPDEAAALYALRCAFVHQYGLLNDGTQSKRKAANAAERRRREERQLSLRHIFELGAEGGDLIHLGDRRISLDTPMSKMEPTFVDLRTLGETVEQLVAALREYHLATGQVTLKPDVRPPEFVRACFFMHRDEIDPQPAAAGPFLPKAAGASVSFVKVDTSSQGVTGFNSEDLPARPQPSD